MKLIKTFKEFINEGAYLNPESDTVVLNWKNDDKNPLEVLKSNDDFTITGFTKLGIKSESFTVYYGLEVDENRIKELQENPYVKLTLDSLKQSLIDGGNAAIESFMKPTIDEIKKNKGTVAIDYIVPLGSRESLSMDMANAIKKYTGGKIKSAFGKITKVKTKIIPLNKYIFSNITHALDWNYIEDYENGVGKIHGKNKKPRKTILHLLKDVVTQEIENASQETILSIKNAKDWSKIKGIMLRSQPQHRMYSPNNHIDWQSTDFDIKSSGISFGGNRKFFKTKYETPKTTGEFGDRAFIEAVMDCVKNNKYMLLIDDNARTKEDMSKIFDSVIKIADNHMDDIKQFGRENVTDSIVKFHNRMAAYVLIFVPDKKIKFADQEDVENLRAAFSEVENFSLDTLKNVTSNIKDFDKEKIEGWEEYQTDVEIED